MKSQSSARAVRRHREKLMYDDYSSEEGSSYYSDSVTGQSLRTITDGSESHDCTNSYSDGTYQSRLRRSGSPSESSGDSSDIFSSTDEEDMPVVISVVSNRADASAKPVRVERRGSAKKHRPAPRAPHRVRAPIEETLKRRSNRLLPTTRPGGSPSMNRRAIRREKKPVSERGYTKASRKVEVSHKNLKEYVPRKVNVDVPKVPKVSTPRRSSNLFKKKSNARSMPPRAPKPFKPDSAYSARSAMPIAAAAAAATAVAVPRAANGTSPFPFVSARSRSVRSRSREPVRSPSPSPVRSPSPSPAEYSLNSRDQLILKKNKMKKSNSKSKSKRDDASSIATDLSSIADAKPMLQQTKSVELEWDGKLPKPGRQSRFGKFRRGVSSGIGGNRGTGTRSLASRSPRGRKQQSSSRNVRNEDASVVSRRSGVSRFSVGAGSVISSASRRSLTSFKSLGSRIGSRLPSMRRKRTNEEDQSPEKERKTKRKGFFGRRNRTVKQEPMTDEDSYSSPSGMEVFIARVTDTCCMPTCFDEGETTKRWKR